MDKTFEHFGNIIQYYPDQCLRYQFNGNPLLYHNQDDISRKILKVSGKKQQAKMNFDNIKHCEKCGNERTFEMQLMPQLLSYLSLNSNASSSNKGEELNLQLKGQNFLDQFDLGLEFGTVLVFSCKNDCNLKDGHAFAKELAYPQHQL
jgi:pre-rRNA-processing protein TSR4